MAVLALLAAALHWSGASLAGDRSALARVTVEAFGGTLASVHASDAAGRPIAVDVHGGRLTPRERIRPGATVTVDAVVRRPGWDAWLLGRTRRERLTVRAPVAHVSDRYVTASANGRVAVRFDQPVSRVRYSGAAHVVSGDRVRVDPSTPAGTVGIRAAARSWERLGRVQGVHYFPAAGTPVALVSPAPGGTLSPADPIRVTLSKTVKAVLGSARPTLSPNPSGRWHTADSHTLVFTPSGYGVGFGTKVHLTLPHTLSVASDGGSDVHSTRTVDWTVPPGSTERLHQLLADEGYLPVRFKASGEVARTRRAEVRAAVDPPAGRFHWRFHNTPPELKRQWDPRKATAITRGAVMAFQLDHGLDVDAVAGPAVFKDLIEDAVTGKSRHKGGYSYVYVHRNTPQLLTLWHNGRTVLTSPGNTGIPQAPTELGTFPVFEHLPVTTMSGTNPDGSTYNDPGIKWVSYFNGGDALHTFNRASFGTPQSLGCVELPEAAAAKIYPYTPIGTLVTIEN